VAKFNEFLGSLPHRHKIVIAGLLLGCVYSGSGSELMLTLSLTIALRKS